MAIKYFTGFEADATILAADGIIMVGGPPLSTAERHRTISGRGGNQCISLISGDEVYMPAFTAGVAEEIAFAVKHTLGAQFFVVFNTSSPSENCSIRLGADGFLRANRGGTVLATSTGVLVAATWNWLLCEITAREAASGGRIRVFLNGSSTAFLDTGAGVDCRASASEDDFQSVEFNSDTGFTLFLDDYFQASAGTLPDEQLFVQTLRPTSDATPTDGTPSTGTDAFAVVDEDPVSTADYNELVAAGNEDRFGMSNLGFTPLSVLAVRTLVHATGEGTLTDIRGLFESGGSTTFGTNGAVTTGGLYGVKGDIFSVDPNGGGALTGAAIDAGIFGYEVN